VNFSCDLPTFGEFASLNLAQAVLLATYLAREHVPPAQVPESHANRGFTPVQPFYFPDASIREWLEAMGFDIQARRASAYLTLRRLFLQNLPTRHELQVLESILQQNIRKLKER
jgi:tRNA/rRNA methyltransferase